MSQNMKTSTFPSPSKNSPQQSTTTFKKRRGTTDLGKDYEHLYIGYLILKLIIDAGIRNFYISSNDEAYGSFDDVIVEIEFASRDQREIYAYQLKHKQKNSSLLTKDALEAGKGDFSVKKYFDDYRETIILHDSVKMILLTGRPTKVKGTLTLDFEGKPFDVEITEIQQMGHLLTSNRGSFHSFSSTNNNRYNDFLENFFLCTGQASVEELRNEIRQDLKKNFHGDESVFQAYLSFIVNWSMKEGTKDKLDKTTMERVTALCVLSSHIQPLSFSSNPVSKRARIFRETISKFDETVIKKDNYTKIKKVWEDIILELGNLQDINKVRAKYQLMIEYIKGIGDLDCENVEASKLLWLLGLCPLVVSESPRTYRVIKFCKNEKFLLLCSASGCDQKLSHLKSEEIYEQILDNFTYSIEGQKEASLRSLVETSKQVDISIDHLADMIDGPLLIGKYAEDLPRCIIPRRLSRILINSKYLKQKNQHILIIISGVQDVEAFRELFPKIQVNEIENLENMKIDSTGIYVNQNECSHSQFEALCSKLKTDTPIHLLRYIHDDHLEWIKSINKIDDLKEFQLVHSNYTIEESQLNSKLQENALNIICSNPGMGKSTLMKTLKKNSSSEFWTILIYARNHAIHFRNNGADVEKFLEHIVGIYLKKYGSLETDVFSDFLQKGHVRIIWDGLDEVSDYTLMIILDIIETLSKQKFNQWITSRNILKSVLEKRFFVFSRNIQPFDRKQQKRYIRERLRLSDEELSEIFEKIVANIQLTASNDILGIPLQIYMLTELFYRDRLEYLRLLEGFFSVADLYGHFVDAKFKVYYLEKEDCNLDIEINYIRYETERKSKISCYQEVAFNFYFDRISKTGTKFVEDIKINLDRIGLITTVTDDNTPEFSHNSYGEYFAALYLCEHYETEVRNRNLISEEKYNNIRFFLDLILSKNCKGHIAVLYKNFELFDACTDDDLNRRDCVGREILEVSCGWSKKITIERNKHLALEENYLQYENVVHNFVKIEYIVKRLMLLLPNTLELYMAALDHNHKKNVFLEAILYYGIESNYPIVFHCIEAVPWLKKSLEYINLQTHLERAITFKALDCIEILLLKFNCLNNLLNFEFTLRICNVTFHKIFGLMKNHLDLNKLLLYACAQGSASEVNFLINQGATVNAMDLHGKTPIHYVSLNKFDYSAILELLVDAGAKINIADLNGDMPLHYVCQTSQSGAQLLINNGADVNVRNQQGLTPLHYACIKRGFGNVKILIDNKAEVNVANQKGDMPIHYACRCWDYRIVELLACNGADVNVTDRFGQMPFHIACGNSKLQIFYLLLDKGAKPDLKDANAVTPAHYACKHDNLKLLKLLMRLNVKFDITDESGRMPIHYACEYGKPSVLEFLIGGDSEVNAADKNGKTPMHYACQNKNATEKLRLLINNGAIVNVQDHSGQMPIHYACLRKDCGQIIKLLVQNGSKINISDQNGKVPIHYMCQITNFTKIVKLLIEHGTSVNVPDQNGQTSMHYACENNEHATVKLLLDAGAEVNIVNHDGHMPIHYASQKGKKELIQLLLDKGANVNVKSNDKKMPAHYACRKSNGYDVLKLLLDNGAQVDVPDSNGKTPLHYACEKGDIHTIQLLIDNHVKVNFEDPNNQMPIHYACQRRRECPDIVKLLIDYGAIVNVLNDEGKMPIHYACQIRKSHQLVKLLKEKGAEVNIPDRNGKMPIHYACGIVDVATVKLLIDTRVDINVADKQDQTPIHYVCSDAHFRATVRNGQLPTYYAPILLESAKLAKLLINNAAEINFAEQGGQTPIHYACANKYVSFKLVKLLIDNKAKVNVVDRKRKTPMHHACGNDSSSFGLIELLINNGAEVNAVDERGQTPIHYACEKDAHVNTIQLLIDNGAAINITDENGRTPLHYICKIKSSINRGATKAYNRLNYHTFENAQNSLRLVKLLIDRGADVNVTDHSDQRAIDYAHQNGESVMVKLLSDNGAAIDISQLKKE